MPTTRSPRHGSMQVWPRKRAFRPYPRQRSWPELSKAQLLGFAGYKVGMTTIVVKDNRKTSLTKGEELAMPVTIIECPPIKIFSARLYKKTPYGLKLSKEIILSNEKELSRKIPLPKEKLQENALDSINPADYDDIRANVFTQPALTSIGKKKPELFEMAIGGSIEEKLNYIKENAKKEIKVSDVFSDGNLVDVHAVTKGKGYQGPVKRFGIGLKHHKSEKGVRRVGSLGGWKAQGHFMYRIAHAGQTGYHIRTEYNKKILMIGSDVALVNPKGGFLHYGFVKNDFIIIKGSVFGSSKRLIRLNVATRPNKKLEDNSFDIIFINRESKQGR